MGEENFKMGKKTAGAERKRGEGRSVDIEKGEMLSTYKGLV